jgi:hypothetical protein
MKTYNVITGMAPLNQKSSGLFYGRKKRGTNEWETV